jgi:hypothetical protein
MGVKMQLRPPPEFLEQSPQGYDAGKAMTTMDVEQYGVEWCFVVNENE